MTTITIDNAEPHLFTSKGHIPFKDLRLVNKREDVAGTVVLVLEYFLGDESVHRSVHVCPLVGVCLEGVAASLPG